MPKEVALTIHWDLDLQVQTFHLKQSSKKWGWRITQRNGVSLMIIRQEDGLRHEIPLDNVLYWSVDTVVTNDSVGNSSFDRYCNSCKEYFDSGQFHGHPIATHDVRRTCCGTSPQHDHHPSCTHVDTKSQQRIGTVAVTPENDCGLHGEAKFNPIEFFSDANRWHR